MDCKEKQRDEAVVLESVFGYDVLNIKTENCWKKWCPLEVCIRLKPSSPDDKIFVSADLHFRCTDTYPDTPPYIKVNDSKGLTTSEIAAMLDTLNTKAGTLKGEPMIYDLCMVCKEILDKLNRKPDESIHDSMMKKQAMVAKEQRRQRADSERREREEIVAENERREQEKRKHDEEMERAKALNFGDIGEAIIVKTFDGEDKTINKKTTSVHRRKPLHRFCSEFVAYDSSLKRDIYVSEWTFTYTLGRKVVRKQEVNFDQFLVKLEQFEATANEKLKSLTDFDQFLYPYTFINLKKAATEPSNFKCSIFIGQDIAADNSCLTENLEFIKNNKQSQLPLLASQAICGIKWLHDRQLNHGHVDEKSLWITKNEGYRLSDAIFMPDILNLCSMFEALTDANASKVPGSPITKTSKMKKIQEAQKKDIFALGTLLDSLSMTNDSMVEDQESDFSKALHSFIKCCQSAKSIEQLVEHKFLSLYFLHMSHLHDSSSDDENLLTFAQFEHSRLAKDFYSFRFLGKGGFGQDYAIKIIPLNANSDQLIRKVTREANLLSRLNHPNVVRYFAAWIEIVASDIPMKPPNIVPPPIKDFDSTDSVVFASGDASFDAIPEENEDESSASVVSDKDDSSSSSSGKGFFRKPKPSFSNPRSRIHTIFSPSMSKSGINSEFDVIDEDDHKANTSTENEMDTESEDQQQQLEKNLPKMLYIQMEYCEGNTLRALIDTGTLFENTKLIWKLFRQILNGLYYIHSQGMIHRDLKPLNVFLTQNMNAKIGDFGLATLEFFAKNVVTEQTESTISMNYAHTQNVGTGYYIASEVSSFNKTYDNRCDVFSVGVVLFEMLYRPLPLGMERMDVLNGLRQKKVEFPSDFLQHLKGETEKARTKKLLTWMLSLDPSQRPMVRDLLQSELVPSVENEQSDFQKKFGMLIRNRKSQFHRWVLEELFALEVSSATDYLYDHGTILDPKFEPRHQVSITNICNDLRNIFHLHGICELANHLLVPYHKSMNTSPHLPVTILQPSASGSMLATLSDLRQNFVRYCARHSIQNIRRFAFGKVFTAASDFQSEVHPIERYESVVDFVAPLQFASNIAAEVLLLIVELEKHLPVLRNLKHTIRIGHSKLLEIISANYGCHDATFRKIQNFFHSLAISGRRVSRDAKGSKLSMFAELSMQTAMALLKQLEPVDSLEELKSRMNKLVKTKPQSVKNASDSAIDEITHLVEAVIQRCDERNISVLFDPAWSYRPSVFNDGLCYALQVEIPNTSKRAIVLAGGRFDTFLASQHHPKDALVPPLCAFGINISVEGLHAIHQVTGNPIPICRVLIYDVSHSLAKEANEIVNEFRLHHLSACIYYGNAVSAEELLEYCKTNSIPFILTIKEPSKVVVYEDLSITKSSRKAIFDDYHQMASSPEEAIKFICGVDLSAHAPGDTGVVSTPSQSTPASIVPSVNKSATATFANLSINYALVNGRPAQNTRKRIESQIQALLQKVMQNFSAKATVEVFVTDLTPETIGQLIIQISRNMNNEELDRVFQQLTAGKQKRDLEALQVALHPFFTSFSGNTSPLVLWTRQSENTYKLIM